MFRTTTNITMIKKLPALLLGLFMLVSSLTDAQDIHFSQFYLSPLNLNPAMTGVMNCNHRLVANFRNQWASVLRGNAYNTFSASYDQRIPVARYDYLGIGGTLWGDRAGQTKFSTLQGRLSASYSKKMGGSRNTAHYLVVGADVGLTQRSIDYFSAQWGLQNDNGVFNGGLASGENNLGRDNFLFADVAAGLLWFSVLDEDNNFYFGGAYSHLNRANQSFDKARFQPLWSKFTIHAGGEFMIADRMGLVPGVVIFLQGPSFQLNAGTSLKFLLSNKNSYDYQAFQAGLWARVANRYIEKNKSGFLVDALILSTRFDYNQFSVGFSYDLNVSSLTAASSYNGGFEFSLVYKICNPDNRGIYCPNF